MTNVVPCDTHIRTHTHTHARAQAEGFSDSITAKFFRPFMGGIFFDRSLGTSSRLFEFVMRMLATGSNCLPVAGIGAVATQLAGRLPADAVRTNAQVEKVCSWLHGCHVSQASVVHRIHGQRTPCPDLRSSPTALCAQMRTVACTRCIHTCVCVCVRAFTTQVTAASGGAPASVTLSDGTSVRAARGVIVAAEGPEARRLVGGQMSGAQASKEAPGVGTACLYFSAPRPPLPGNVLYLNGEDDGIVNNA